MTPRWRLLIRAAVLAGVVPGLLAACTPPPRYICLPAKTDTGRQVILCQPLPVETSVR